MKQPFNQEPGESQVQQHSDFEKVPQRSIPVFSAEEALARMESFREHFVPLPEEGLNHDGFMAFYAEGLYEMALHLITAKDLRQDKTNRLALYLTSAALGAFHLPVAEQYLAQLRKHQCCPPVTDYLDALLQLQLGHPERAEALFHNMQNHLDQMPAEFSEWGEQLHAKLMLSAPMP